MTKRKHFAETVTRLDYDILLITETWLTPLFSNRELFLTNYQIYRAESPFSLNCVSLHGAVLLGVKMGIRHSEVPRDTLPPSFSSSLVLVELFGNSKYLIAVLYNPPQDSQYCITSDDIRVLFHFLSTFTNHKIVLTGDFNLPKVDWITYSSTDDYENEILSLVINNNMKQIIDFKTTSTSIYDLILTNSDADIIHAERDSNFTENFRITMLLSSS